jgi:hypothetical protein
VAQGLVAAAQGDPAAAASMGDKLSTDSSFLSTLDPNIARPFQVGYVDSTHLVYIIGGIIMVIAFLLVLVMKELPLRLRSALDERLQEQADEDALLAADAAKGELPSEADLDALDARDEGRESVNTSREPVVTGAHALVGSGGADASDGDVVLNGATIRGVTGSGETRRRGRHRAEV